MIPPNEIGVEFIDGVFINQKDDPNQGTFYILNNKNVLQVYQTYDDPNEMIDFEEPDRTYEGDLGCLN